MALVKKCDICGKEVSYTKTRILPKKKIESVIESQGDEEEPVTEVSYKLGDYDVCPDCLKDLDAVINEVSWEFIQGRKSIQENGEDNTGDTLDNSGIGDNQTVEYEYTPLVYDTFDGIPAEQDWYELIDGEYVPTEDLEFDSDKTYYVREVKGE